MLRIPLPEYADGPLKLYESDARVVYRELREAHDRTTARWPAAPWMLARASAKRMRSQEGSTRETLGCEQLTFNWELQGSGATELGTGNCGFAAPRVARSCTLLEMGTFSFLVSERLRIASTASVFTAKTRREVRLNPSETDLPRLCEAGALSLMCRMCSMCPITRPVPWSLIYRALSTANR